MAVYQIDWHWFTAWDNGYHTVEVNIPPATVGVQAALYGQSGGGTSFAGIKHYRRRLDSGADQDWPAVIFDHISSVTLALAEGSDQEDWLVGRLDYWG